MSDEPAFRDALQELLLKSEQAAEELRSRFRRVAAEEIALLKDLGDGLITELAPHEQHRPVLQGLEVAVGTADLEAKRLQEAVEEYPLSPHMPFGEALGLLAEGESYHVPIRCCARCDLILLPELTRDLLLLVECALELIEKSGEATEVVIGFERQAKDLQISISARGVLLSAASLSQSEPHWTLLRSRAAWAGTLLELEAAEGQTTLLCTLLVDEEKGSKPR